jgi:hypothetical protein
MNIEFPDMYCTEIKNCVEFVRLIIEGFKYNSSLSSNEFARIFDAWYKTHSKSIPEFDLHYLKIYEVGINISSVPIERRRNMHIYNSYNDKFKTQMHEYILQTPNTINSKRGED